MESIDSIKIRFKTIYGEKKYYEIESKIHNSNKVRRLINLSSQKHLVPHKNDYLYSLNEVPYFIFSKADTLAMGAILSLELWHMTLNNNYQYADRFEIEEIIYGILQDCEKLKIKI